MAVFALSAAIALFAMAGIAALFGHILQGHTQSLPINNGTDPRTRETPMVPQTVTTTTNYYIDTINVYQAAPVPVEQPQTIPAEVRRIRPAIGR